MEFVFYLIFSDLDQQIASLSMDTADFYKMENGGTEFLHSWVIKHFIDRFDENIHRL